MKYVYIADMLNSGVNARSIYALNNIIICVIFVLMYVDLCSNCIRMG